MDFVFEAINREGIDRIRSLVTKTDDNTVTSDGENNTVEGADSEETNQGEETADNSVVESTDSEDTSEDQTAE